MDAPVEKLDAKLGQWKPETAAQVRQQLAEVIELADHDVLDIVRSRAAEQEALDLLDEPTTRVALPLCRGSSERTSGPARIAPFCGKLVSRSLINDPKVLADHRRGRRQL